MAPLVETVPLSQLEKRLQYQPDGKRRKEPVNLKDCALKELIQFECDIVGPRRDPRSKVVCQPILRFFRQCANGLTVETTSTEEV
ncbi:putative mitochondrial export protein Som1 [Teratosphaeria destructans]|uniref:Mitochondrial export protein Som1 n=1 Tax=Teratosphaeria destructans TaxID=418781 RepID=A0A9W7SWJ9_9PEZI|nr:putative mitochondrial export protein Som1 [Teratosphaeria destructans]